MRKKIWGTLSVFAQVDVRNYKKTVLNKLWLWNYYKKIVYYCTIKNRHITAYFIWKVYSLIVYKNRCFDSFSLLLVLRLSAAKSFQLFKFKTSTEFGIDCCSTYQRAIHKAYFLSAWEICLSWSSSDVISHSLYCLLFITAAIISPSSIYFSTFPSSSNHLTITCLSAASLRAICLIKGKGSYFSELSYLWQLC